MKGLYLYIQARLFTVFAGRPQYNDDALKIMSEVFSKQLKKLRREGDTKARYASHQAGICAHVLVLWSHIIALLLD